MKKILIFISVAILLISQSYALHSDQRGNISAILSEYLDTNGDQSGDFNMTGDYSAGNEIYIQPPENVTYRLARILITVGDAGIDSADEYGSIGKLANGVAFWTEHNGIRTRIDGNLSITNNGDYVRLMYDFNCDLASLANGIDYCTGRWTFDKSGTMIRLAGDTNDKLVVTFNDSFVGLNEHTFLVQGYAEPETEEVGVTNELIIWLGTIIFLYVVIYNNNKNSYGVRWLGAILMSVVGYNVIYVDGLGTVMDSQISLIVILVSVLFAIYASLNTLGRVKW